MLFGLLILLDKEFGFAGRDSFSIQPACTNSTVSM